MRPIASAAALAAIALLVVRAWRIDQPYSIDFQTYWLAGQRVAAGEASTLFDAGGGPAAGIPLELPAGEFKNLPVVAVPFVPLASLPYLEAKRVFFWLGLLAIVAGGGLAGIAALPRTFADRPTRAAVGIALTCLLAPGHAALRHGQTTPIVLLAMSTWLFARDRHPRFSGASLGLACLVKFPPLALLALDAARGRLRGAVAAVATLVGAAVLSIALFGLPLHRAYAANVAGNAGTVMTGHNNQSIVAIATRLAIPSSPQDWTPRPVPPAIGALAGVVGLLLIVATAWAILRSPRAPENDALAIPLAATLGIVALPVAWDHYVLLAAPALLALLGGLHAKGLLDRRGFRLAFSAAFLVLALPTPTAWLEGEAPAGFLRALALSGDGLALLAVWAIAFAALRVRR